VPRYAANATPAGASSTNGLPVHNPLAKPMLEKIPITASARIPTINPINQTRALPVSRLV
jgi:hypothetical protein